MQLSDFEYAVTQKYTKIKKRYQNSDLCLMEQVVDIGICFAHLTHKSNSIQLLLGNYITDKCYLFRYMYSDSDNPSNNYSTFTTFNVKNCVSDWHGFATWPFGLFYETAINEPAINIMNNVLTDKLINDFKFRTNFRKKYDGLVNNLWTGLVSVNISSVIRHKVWTLTNDFSNDGIIGSPPIYTVKNWKITNSYTI